MGYGEPGWDWDTQEQADKFYEYLQETGEDRTKHHKGYGYNEAEWEAFCYGWNAAKKHFGVKE